MKDSYRLPLLRIKPFRSVLDGKSSIYNTSFLFPRHPPKKQQKASFPKRGGKGLSWIFRRKKTSCCFFFLLFECHGLLHTTEINNLSYKQDNCNDGKKSTTCNGMGTWLFPWEKPFFCNSPFFLNTWGFSFWYFSPHFPISLKVCLHWNLRCNFQLKSTYLS